MPNLRPFDSTITTTTLPQRVLDKLHDAGALYVCPRGTNDDIFWMYATLYTRTIKTGGHGSNCSGVDGAGDGAIRNLTTPTPSTITAATATTTTTATTATIVPRQFPGLVVSNDLMRDHKLHAFEDGRVFMRWRTQHIVNFVLKYGEWLRGEGGREVTLFPPSKFNV